MIGPGHRAVGGRAHDGPLEALPTADGNGWPAAPDDEDGPSLRLLVVSDQPALAHGLQALLRREPDLARVDTLTDPSDTVRVVNDQKPDVVLLRLASGEARTTVVAELQAMTDPPLVVAVVGQDLTAAVGAVGAGALGVLSSDASVDQVVAAIKRVVGGGTWIPAELLSLLVQRLAEPADGDDESDATRVARLTSRELDILRLMVNGLNRAAISARLYRSPNTVRTHIGNIMTKMGAHSAAEVVAIALRAGMRPDPTAPTAAPIAWRPGS